MTIVTVTPNTSVDRTLEVPRFAVGGHLKGRLLRVQPAGKGVNVSRCLAALGVPSVVTGLVGEGELPLFRESLAGSPATVDLVPVAGATRTSTTILDPELGTDTHIREMGSAVTPEEVERLRLKLAVLASPDALIVFCGSLPPGLSDEGLALLLATCRAKGARVGADLNGPQLGVAVAAGPAVIKPNVQELGECLGADLSGASEAELVAAARSLLDRARTVLVTRGRDGALAVQREEAWSGIVHVSSTRNTVGCGDAFLAGYLAALAGGVCLGDALRQALACGAAQALADGPGQIAEPRVRELAARAQLRRLI